jgi:hypothetical protein
MGGYELDSSGSGQRPVVGYYVHSYEPSGSIKCWEFLQWLSSCWLLKKDLVFIESVSQSVVLFETFFVCWIFNETEGEIISNSVDWMYCFVNFATVLLFFSIINEHEGQWAIYILKESIRKIRSFHVEYTPAFFFSGCIALVGLGRFFSSLTYTQSVGHLGRMIIQPQGRYLRTGQHNTE